MTGFTYGLACKYFAITGPYKLPLLLLHSDFAGSAEEMPVGLGESLADAEFARRPRQRQVHALGGRAAARARGAQQLVAGVAAREPHDEGPRPRRLALG